METRLIMPLGYTLGGTPVYPLSGSAPGIEIEPDDPEDDIPDEGEDDPQDDPDEGGKGKGKKGSYVPPDEKEWIRVQASLNRSNASAKEKRLAAVALQRKVQELQDEKAARDAEDERRKLLAERQPAAVPAPVGSGKGRRNQPEPAPQPGPAELPANVLTPAQVRAQVDKARREERETVASEYLDIARRSAARVALADAQVPKESIGRLTRLLDLEEIELDASGEVVGGLDDQVESLRSEFPQLFAPAAAPAPERKPRPRPPRIPQANSADRAPAQDAPRSTAQQMADAILGGGR